MNGLQRWSARLLVAGVVTLTVSLLFHALPVDAGGACRGQPVTESKGLTVHFEGVCLSPTILRVRAGDTVTWINDRDKASHTVTGANASWGDFTEVAPGQSVSHLFTTAGVYPYYCFIHPGMIGAIIVGDAGSNAKVGLASSGNDQQAGGASAVPAGDDNTVRTIGLAGGIAVAAVVCGAGGFALGRRQARR